MRLCHDNPGVCWRFLTDKLLICLVRFLVTPTLFPEGEFEGETEILLQRSASRLGFRNILFCSFCVVGDIIFNTSDIFSVDNSNFGDGGSWQMSFVGWLSTSGTTWSSFCIDAVEITLALCILSNCRSRYSRISVAVKRSALVVRRWFLMSFRVGSDTLTSLGRTTSHWEIFLKSATVVFSTKGKFE